MTTFADRIEPAVRFEQAVVDRFNGSPGWRAFAFGQSQLPAECRSLLVRYEDGARRPCLIRWMPDVIAFRVMPKRTFVALVDAKVCNGRPNYAVEMSAAETSEAFTDQLYTPTFFVFDDWRVMTPREVRQRGRAGPNRSGGSGTPYYLIEKGFSRPFDDVFPPAQET